MFSKLLPFLKRHSVVIGLFGIAVAVPSLYAFYMYLKKGVSDENQQENLRQKRLEKLTELREKLERLLLSLDEFVPEIADNEDDECIVCNSAKATIQTFPCKHKVLCRTCFVKTLQVAVDDMRLPLTCVLCRTSIATLDRERHEELINTSVVK